MSPVPQDLRHTRAQPEVQPRRPTPTVRTGPVSAATWREAVVVFRHAARTSTEPPRTAGIAHQVAYGIAQPILGLRMVLADRAMFGEALAPVLVIAGLCLIVASFEMSSGGLEAAAVRFFAVFVALAPVPSILFTRHYARIAARTRDLTGLGPVAPYYKRIRESIYESIAMVIVLFVGAMCLVPLSAFGGIGAAAAAVLGAGWTLHWMAIEGLDNAKTLPPGASASTVRGDTQAFLPWFYRAAHSRRVPGPIRRPLSWVAGIVHRLSSDWRAELALVERHPFVALGYAVGMTALLAVPGLNLLFRPALATGGSHLRGQLERGEQLAAQLGSTSHPV